MSYQMLQMLRKKLMLNQSGRRSLNPVKRKHARVYGNTDQKRLMDSLNNAGGQLKEIQIMRTKIWRTLTFFFCKCLVVVLEDLTFEQNMEPRTKIQQVLFEILFKFKFYFTSL